MKWSAEAKLKFVIERDENVGYYVYVFSEKTGKCVQDYLQDSLEQAQGFCERMFGVPTSAWREEPDDGDG